MCGEMKICSGQERDHKLCNSMVLLYIRHISDAILSVLIVAGGYFFISCASRVRPVTPTKQFRRVVM